MKIKFPQDFEKIPHPVIPTATQWSYTKPNGTTISIVGGGFGLYGDGINDFEMFDFDEEGPRGYMSIDEINNYLSTIPGILEPRKEIIKHKFI